jgi:pimeloyl-ACP methyl ester carboxylesterase
MPRARGLLTGAVVAGAAGAAGALLAKRLDSRWAAADSPSAAAQFLLPVGTAMTVETDDGASLAVSVSGPADGPVVVLPHCWTGGREVWAPVAHRLVAQGFRVVLYDQRGHGSSTVGSDGFTIERLGADLAAVLSAVDGQDVVLAGHSMGGMTVMALATWFPDVLAARARAIVLVATAASGMGRGARADAFGQRVIASAWLERAMRSGMGHGFVRGVIGRTVRRSDMVLTRDLFVACPPEARSGWLRAMQGMDLRKGIAAIDMPTTVMIGTRDTLTPPSRAAELVDTIPGASLVELRGYGHMLPLEAPDEVAAEIASAAHAPRRAART